MSTAAQELTARIQAVSHYLLDTYWVAILLPSNPIQHILLHVDFTLMIERIDLP